jgi:hypothetical protein
MRKMVLMATFAAILALTLAASPAFADTRFDRNDFCDFFDCNNNGFFDDSGIGQFSEQDVESGDATQNIDVTGGGDNSNQTAGVQGVTNTGNATNNTSVLQAGNPFFDGNVNRNDFCDVFDCNDRFFDRFDEGFFFNDGFFNDGFGFGGNEVDIEDVGNFEISPSQTVTGDQQVNQAASASR